MVSPKHLPSTAAFQFPPILFKFRPSYHCPGLLNWVPYYCLVLFTLSFFQYCRQINFLNYSSDHINSLLKKLHFPLPSKSFHGVLFKVIQRSVLNFPPQPYFSVHPACTAHAIKSDHGQDHSFSALSALHNPFTREAHHQVD